MPDKCCVTGCKSNYDNSNEYFSVFRFPKEPELRDIWIRKIPRKNFVPSARSVVCEKHFADEDVIKFDELPNKDGTVTKIRRSIPKLKTGAYPKIFLNCPKYLTEKQLPSRVSRDDKLETIDKITLDKFMASEQQEKLLLWSELENLLSFLISRN
ncbi:THAP domain-containing protein 2-like, partial [Uloborus diversus]|uniref:THAP domain-containing protein 2-like n=1 Tax=Uloborus diversus TaxID=327109 RepID=UPI002409EBA6